MEGTTLEHEHLDAATLDRLLELDRTEDQDRSLLHQIAVCPACRQVGGWLLDLHEAGALAPQFGLVDVALARSRASAPGLWKDLSLLAHEERLQLVSTDRRFVSWGLAELLARQSEEIAREDAAQAVAIAELAVHVADTIEDNQPAEAGWTHQLRALTWAYLSNARRVEGNLPVAERASEMAEVWWTAEADPIGDALGYEPVLLDLKASLRIAQRRFDEAFLLLDEAADIYSAGELDLRDPHLAGRALVKKGAALIENGETERAIATFKQAEPLIDRERSPRLFLCLHHNLVDNLAKAGRFAEAEPLLSGVKELAAAHGKRLDKVRLDWVEARVAAGLGERDRARKGFEGVRQEFLDLEMAYDAALASLELAGLYIEEGETAAVKVLAAEMVAVFRLQDVQRECLAAAITFHQAAERETASSALVRAVAATVGRARAGSIRPDAAPE
jgi:tetratricopeptide (TPR) repeat protein